MVVIEITLKVRENQKALEKVQSHSINGRALMSELVASKKKVARWVKILQIMVTILIVVISSAALVILVVDNHKYSDRANKLDRLERALIMSDWASNMSWAFLVLAVLLCVSVVFLLIVLKRELKDNRTSDEVHLIKEFKGEICRLFTMLILFMISYALRFYGDYVIVPKLVSEDNMIGCIVNE